MKLSQYLPRNHVDAIAMVFTFVMIPVSYLHGVFYIAPTLWPSTSRQELGGGEGEDNSYPYYCSVFLMTFLFLNTMLNLVLTVTVDTSCGRVPLPIVEQPGWYFCPYCRYHTPPRAHHCPTCRQCVLRRDHHCFFAGKCVGYYNHRYFVAFLVYLTISALYGLVTSIVAVYRLAGGFSLTYIPAFVFPVIGWVFQLMPVNPFVMIEGSLALLVSVMAAGLLAVQLYTISRGQTYYELQKNVCTYRRGTLENFVDVLGRNWWFCWLFPLLPSPRPGDGAHYPPRDRQGVGNAGIGVPPGPPGGGGAKRKAVKST